MIELHNLKIAYKDKTVIENFNLNVLSGEKVIIKGVSGSGKSSILKAILGFVIPASGDIFFNNERITGKNISYFRTIFSYVSQGIELRNEKVIVLIEEIFNFKQNKKFKNNLEKMEELLDFFNLKKEILEKNLDELSGGEKQRIGIITSILLDRDIFLLDEITSALDSEMKKKTVNYFLKSSKTVIIVSHDNEWSESGIAREVKI